MYFRATIDYPTSGITKVGTVKREPITYQGCYTVQATIKRNDGAEVAYVYYLHTDRSPSPQTYNLYGRSPVWNNQAYAGWMVSSDTCPMTAEHAHAKAVSRPGASSFVYNIFMPSWRAVGGTGAPEEWRDYDTWGAYSFPWRIQWPV